MVGIIDVHELTDTHSERERVSLILTHSHLNQSCSRNSYLSGTIQESFWSGLSGCYTQYKSMSTWSRSRFHPVERTGAVFEGGKKPNKPVKLSKGEALEGLEPPGSASGGRHLDI